MPQQGALPDIASRMAQMYKPDTSASDAFDKLQSEYPQAPKPGIGRRIGAAALGAVGDINNLFDNHGKFNPSGRTGSGQGIFDQVTGKTDYNEKITDWKNKIGPAQQSANIERQTNSNERQAAYQAAALQLRDEAQAAKQSNDEKKIAISEHRAQVYEFKAKHPGVKFDFKGPTVIVSDPISGEVTDTGIPTGSMSQMDKLNLGHENKMEEIGATGDENRKTEGVKNTNVLGQIGARGDEARQTKETPSGNQPGNKPPTPAATRTQQTVTARQLINTRPDLAPFIKIDGNDFKVVPPSTGGMFSKGPSPAQHKEILDAIYGSGGSPNPQSSSQPLQKQVRNKTTGEVKTVYSHDGGKTWGDQ